MAGSLGRNPAAMPEDYPLERVREQYVKAADYFRKALEAHGKTIAAANVRGLVLVAARGEEAARLRSFCEREGIAGIQQGPQN